MARAEMKVKLVGDYQYDRQKYAGYGYETVNIYKMADDNGNIYVWKTTSWLAFNDEPINRGSVIVIVATIKGESEYKGEKQTEINRVKVKEVIEMGKSIEQIQAEREKAREAKKPSSLHPLRVRISFGQCPTSSIKRDTPIARRLLTLLSVPGLESATSMSSFERVG